MVRVQNLIMFRMFCGMSRKGTDR